MDLEQRLSALEEADKKKTLLIEAQAETIALLSSENVVQRRPLEAQQRLVGELSNSVFPAGHWVQKVGEVGQPAPWKWSLERYKVMTSPQVRPVVATSLSTLPVEVLKQIVRSLHPSRADLASLSLVSFLLFEVSAPELYHEVEINLDTAPLLFLQRPVLSRKGPPRSLRIKPYVNLSNTHTLIVTPLPQTFSIRNGTSSSSLSGSKALSPPYLSLTRTGSTIVRVPVTALILRSSRHPSKDFEDCESILNLVNPKTWRFEGPEPKGELSPRLQCLEQKVDGHCFRRWDRLEEVVFTGKSVLEEDGLKKALTKSLEGTGTLEYSLVSKYKTSADSVVNFGVDALEDQLELAGRVASKRKKGDEVVGASLTLRVVAAV